MRKFPLCISLAPAVILPGCEHAEPFFADDGGKLVIEGHIDADGYPVVILTKSASGSSGNIAENIVNWGKVSISDGDTTIILTGGIDKQHFPPYSYRTYAMQGCPGKTYSLVAEYGSLRATAVSQMPRQTVNLCSINVEPVEDSDTLRSIIAQCRATGPGYVKIFSRVRHKDVQLLPSPLSNYSIPAAGQELAIQVYRGKSMLSDTHNYSPHFTVGDTVDVGIASVTEETFNFWTAYDNSTTFGSGFISTPANIADNIANGYGIWSAQAVLRQTIIIE